MCNYVKIVKNKSIAFIYIFVLHSFKSVIDFHDITDETLEALSDFFDGLADTHRIPSPDDYDVNFGVSRSLA